MSNFREDSEGMAITLFVLNSDLINLPVPHQIFQLDKISLEKETKDIIPQVSDKLKAPMIKSKEKGIYGKNCACDYYYREWRGSNFSNVLRVVFPEVPPI